MPCHIHIYYTCHTHGYIDIDIHIIHIVACYVTLHISFHTDILHAILYTYYIHVTCHAFRHTHIVIVYAMPLLHAIQRCHTYDILLLLRHIIHIIEDELCHERYAIHIRYMLSFYAYILLHTYMPCHAIHILHITYI